MAIDKIQLVKIIIIYLFVMCSIIGLNSNFYSWRSRRFNLNFILILWCIIVTIAFCWIYIGELYNEIITDQLDLKNGVALYYYVNLIGATTNYFSQLLYSKASMNFYRNSHLFETMKYFDLEVDVIHTSILMVLLKTVVFPIILEITLILRQLREEDVDKSLWWTLHKLFPLIIANVVPNCLFASLVVCRQLVLSLNSKVERLVKEANLLQNKEQIILQKPFYRMQRFCYLADNLDEYAEKYWLICSQTLGYMNLCAAPLLASLLGNLFGVTAGFFRQYDALADTLINEETYDVFNAVTNGVFLLISFFEIALHGLVTNQSIEALKDTGLILKRIKLDYADVRFRQAVEKFSFEIATINFKIQPMRLLNIDLGLLHDVLSAVTSFLLILIQSDLTLRFSLK